VQDFTVHVCDNMSRPEATEQVLEGSEVRNKLLETDIFTRKMSVSGNQFLAPDSSKTYSVASGRDMLSQTCTMRTCTGYASLLCYYLVRLDFIISRL
jgi:hypothetical protein